MKNAVKLSGAMLRMAISTIVLTGALFAATLSMTACDNGTTSGGGNKIFGLSYNMKFYTKGSPGSNRDDYTGEVTTYILEHSFKEAFDILEEQFRRLPNFDKTLPKDNLGDFYNYRIEHPDFLAFQEEHDTGHYFLVRNPTPGYHNDGYTYTYAFEKPYEREGTIRITNIPNEYNGKFAGFDIHDESWWLYVLQTFDPPPLWGTYEIRNGSVEIPMWWTQGKMYDRKSGTFNHGERYKIYLTIRTSDYSSVCFSFPSITFVNGHAELNFSKAKYDPEGAKS